MEHLFGQTCALLAALTWAIALVLFKRSGEHIAPIELNLFKNVVALVLFAPTLLLEFVLVEGSFDAVQQSSWIAVGVLMLSGIIGIALADTVFFYALNLIGVGLFTIVDCAYTPLVLLFSWLLLSQELTALHYVGGILIIGGVFIASRHAPPTGRTRAQITAGILLALLAIGSMAFGIVIAKPYLDGCPLITATVLRLGAGTVALALFARLGAGWKQNWKAFRPSAQWKVALPASILGAYLAMVFWIAGFKYTFAPVAAVLNQTSVVFASILAVIILKESFGKRKITAVGLAMVGVVIVTFSEWLLAAWHELLAA